jgi:type I restriction enzyme S subunit
MSFDSVAIDDICELVRGSSPRPQGDPRFFGGSVPRLMVADMTRDGMYVTPSIDSLTEEGAKQSRPMKAGDVVMVVSGLVGLPSILKIDACIHDGLVGFRNLDKKVMSEYLYYWLLSSQEHTRTQTSGAIWQNLTTEQIKEWKLPLPPLTEQKRIASLLARADRLRSLRRTAHELGESLLQSVFLEMFGDVASNSKNWDMCIIDEVVKFSQYGTSDKSNSEQRGYPVLGMANITYEGRIDLEKLSYVELSDKEFADLKLERGDVIFNRTNSTELVGKTAFWNYDFDAVIASYLVKLKLKKDVLPEYFVALLNTPHFKRLFQERCKKAVGQSNISPTLLKEFPMIVPPLNLQEEFAGVVARVESLRGRMSEAGRQVEGLFESLLAETMDNGR